MNIKDKQSSDGCSRRDLLVFFSFSSEWKKAILDLQCLFMLQWSVVF